MSTHDLEEGESRVRAWLEAARDGSSSSLGQLLDVCRNYLLLVANQTLDDELRAKIAPSDLVQETFLRAQNHWRDFQGASEDELLAWLRQILVNQVRDARREFHARKRQINREVIDSPGQLQAEDETPSGQAMAAEQRVSLEQAMAQLPADYRQVVILRNWERCSFKEIGDAMGCSAEAARKLWARGIEKLQKLLENPAANST